MDNGGRREGRKKDDILIRSRGRKGRKGTREIPSGLLISALWRREKKEKKWSAFRNRPSFFQIGSLRGSGVLRIRALNLVASCEKLSKKGEKSRRRRRKRRLKTDCAKASIDFVFRHAAPCRNGQLFSPLLRLLRDLYFRSRFHPSTLKFFFSFLCARIDAQIHR